MGDLHLTFMYNMCRYALILCAALYYVWIYYAGGQDTIIPINGWPSPTEAILNLSAAEGGIAFPLFSEDISLFFSPLSFLLVSSFWQECRLGLGIGVDSGGWWGGGVQRQTFE